jgi:hypothetical protein
MGNRTLRSLMPLLICPLLRERVRSPRVPFRRRLVCILGYDDLCGAVQGGHCALWRVP